MHTYKHTNIVVYAPTCMFTCMHHTKDSRVPRTPPRLSLTCALQPLAKAILYMYLSTFCRAVLAHTHLPYTFLTLAYTSQHEVGLKGATVASEQQEQVTSSCLLASVVCLARSHCDIKEGACGGAVLWTRRGGTLNMSCAGPRGGPLIHT